MKHYLLQCSYLTKPYNEAAIISSVIPLFIIIALLFFYLVAVHCLQQRKKHWNCWRIFSFASGIILLIVAMCPSMLSYAHHSFNGHMIQHLLIGMLAPVGLVMGAPITLALKTVPVRTARLIAAMLGSNFFHILSHPITTLLLNIGGMFVFYLTPLYNIMFYSSSLHYLIHLHFLLAGYLFTWSIVGPDPAPKRPNLQLRLFILFISIAAHAYLSKMMYAYVFPRTALYSNEEIQQATKLMYYGGDLSEMMLVFILFTIWYKKNKNPKYRIALLAAN